MHLYSFALFPIFAIPLAIASSVDPPLYNFFNMSTPMLVSVPGIFFLVSLFKIKCPFWVSSDAPGTQLKPGVFYLFEDIGAVDFRHGKEFRRQLHARCVKDCSSSPHARPYSSEADEVVSDYVNFAGTMLHLCTEISCGGRPFSGFMDVRSTLLLRLPSIGPRHSGSHTVSSWAVSSCDLTASQKCFTDPDECRLVALDQSSSFGWCHGQQCPS